MPAALKPAYLIHGEDHGAVAERRRKLCALAEEQGDAASVEVLTGEDAAPEGVARALARMTFAIGQRVIVVDGVERWKEAEIKEHLLPALGELPPDTTLALFAREEGRTKTPAAVHKAVKAAGGQVVAQAVVKPWELPRWVREQAPRLGLALDQAAAKALVAQVGERQQRLLRELEKLALELTPGPGGGAGQAAGHAEGTGEESPQSQPPAVQAPPAGPVRVSAEQIEARAAHSAERRAFALADALVAGDRRAATLTYLRLRQQGERISGLTYLMAGRLRDAVAISTRLQAGESPAEVARGLRMPPRAADRLVADVRRSDPARLSAALGVLADLELDTRGGAPLRADRTGHAALGEDTLALRALAAMTG